MVNDLRKGSLALIQSALNQTGLLFFPAQALSRQFFYADSSTSGASKRNCFCYIVVPRGGFLEPSMSRFRECCGSLKRDRVVSVGARRRPVGARSEDLGTAAHARWPTGPAGILDQQLRDAYGTARRSGRERILHRAGNGRECEAGRSPRQS